MFMGVRDMYYSAHKLGFHFENGNDGTLSLSFSPWSKRITEHYVLTYDGTMLHIDLDDDRGEWVIIWQSLESECDIYGKCGEFGICDSNNLPICSCLRGFKPRNNQEWSAGNWSNGCVRRTPLLQCGTIGGQKDGFLRLPNIKVPDNAEWLVSEDEEDCRRQCLENCSCSAYAYYFGFGCMVWSGSLIDIQNFSPVGVDLFIRLAHSELGDTSKWKTIIAVIVIMSIVVIVILLYYGWRWMVPRYGRTATSKEAKGKYCMIGAGTSLNKFHDLPLLKI